MGFRRFWVFIVFSVFTTEQEGASEADLSVLPKYKFHILSNGEKTVVGAGKLVPVETTSGYLANERLLLPEDAVSYCAMMTALLF